MRPVFPCARKVALIPFAKRMGSLSPVIARLRDAKLPLWAALPLVALGLLVACNDDGSPSEESPAPATTADASGAAATATGTPQTGRVVGRLPDDFPAEFPVYKGVVIERGDTHPDRFIVDFRSVDDPGAVADFYERSLATDPWRIAELDDSQEEITIIEFESGGDPAYSGTVAIAPLGGLTRILLVLWRAE